MESARKGTADEMDRMAKVTEKAPGIAANAAAGGGTVNIVDVNINAEVSADSYQGGRDAAKGMEDEFDSYLSEY